MKRKDTEEELARLRSIYGARSNVGVLARALLLAHRTAQYCREHGIAIPEPTEH